MFVFGCLSRGGGPRQRSRANANHRPISMDTAEAVIEGLTNRILEALPFVVGVVVLYLMWRWIWGKPELDQWGRETETNPRRHEIARSLLWFALTAILLYELVSWLISSM